MRAVIPGYIQYIYTEMALLQDTQAIFNDYDILTIQGVVVVNTLIVKHKIRHFPLALPQKPLLK